MDILEDMLVQDAVYWAPLALDDDGQQGFDTPVAIKCRWEDVQAEIVNASGDQEISSSTVYVDRDLAINGVLFLGVWADLTSETEPFSNPGAKEIHQTMKLPTLDGDEFLRAVYL